MKHVIKYGVFVLLVSFIFLNKVNAECSYQERKQLLNEAKAVDIFYEIKENTSTSTGVNSYGEKVELTDTKYEFIFKVLNLTDNLLIKYYNTLTYEEENYIGVSNLENGIFSFTDTDYSTLYTYYFEVYSAHENCMGNKIHTHKFVKPIYNGFSDYEICNEEELVDFKYCKKFVTEKFDIDESEFLKLANENITKVEKESENKNFNLWVFIKEYIIYFIIFVLLLISGVILVVLKRKKSML